MNNLLNSINEWIGAHQFLVVSVIVPVISAFIAWRGVVGSNQSLKASLEFQREQSTIERRLQTFHEARDALSDLSTALIDVHRRARRLPADASADQVNSLAEKIDDLHSRFYQAIFRYNQIFGQAIPLTNALHADLETINAILGSHGSADDVQSTQLRFPPEAIVVLRNAGKAIEGVHI